MSSPVRGLTIDVTLFRALVEELACRGDGVRESGAFLLTSTQPTSASMSSDSWQAVTGVAFYDDLDRISLTGAISFGADGYTALGVVCRRDEVRVVGDIHTHPGDWVDQSGIDAAHPMVALPGHVAFIAPRHAQGRIETSCLGAHVFDGAGRWTSHFGDDVANVLRLTQSPSTTTSAAATPHMRLRGLCRFLRRLTPWRSR